MKKLSLLIFAILILSCDTETTVVEEPVIEEPEPVIEEPPPVVIIDEPSHHPLIADGNVKHGEVNVDPELLNRDGFRFSFKEPFASYWVTFREKDGEYLLWDTPFPDKRIETENLFIRRLEVPHNRLKYDTEYEISIVAQSIDCDVSEIVIRFRTRPRRPVAGRPEPVIQERPPDVPLGERFRWDIIEPSIIAGDVAPGADNVDPEPLNENGIRFEFDEPIIRYKIDLRLKDGATLGWLPRGLVKREDIPRDIRLRHHLAENWDMLRHIKIMPAAGFPLLEFDTEYEIDVFVQDFQCATNESTIGFRTKPKP